MKNSLTPIPYSLFPKNMKIFPLVIALTATLSSVILIPTKSQAQNNRVIYKCEKQQSLGVTFADETAAVTFSDGKITILPQVIAGSGARYSDGVTTFWTKGEGAFVEVNNKITIDNCVAQKDTSSSSTLTSDQNLQGTSWKLVSWGTENALKIPLQETEINAEFTADRISGLGSCNRYNGGYQAKNGELMFSPIASTRKACPPEIMDQEFKYFTKLQGAKKYQINTQGQLKIFYQTKEGEGVMIFDPKSTESQPIRGRG